MSRRHSTRAWLVAVIAATIVLFPAVPIGAQGGSVTLSVSSDTIDYGQSVTVSGAVSSAAAGEAVTIVDDEDAALAEATTGEGGAFEAVLTPERNVSIRALWSGATSEPAAVGVRVEVRANLYGVRLFGDATVGGRVLPAHPGSQVTVTFLRAGKTIRERSVTIAADGSFQARFHVSQPGTHRARVQFAADGDHLGATKRSVARTTQLPSLSIGSHGTFVRLLESRLQELDYRIEGIDATFDYRTSDALIAFHKVQRMARVGTVNGATWRKLATPIRPNRRFTSPAFHSEIDQTRQVLYTVQDGAITSISHVSTGKASTPTYDGTFAVYKKVAGTYHGLYYPSYFDGGRAIHGWVEVPTYNASHGCIRFPFWNAVWIYNTAKMGTVIHIYH
jgi:L,D-transpeptidase catalytic domain